MLFIIGVIMVGVSAILKLIPQLASLPLIGGFISTAVTWVDLIGFLGGMLIGITFGGFNKRGLVYGLATGIIVVIFMIFLGGLM